jgi:DNA replication protein DnaC
MPLLNEVQDQLSGLLLTNAARSLETILEKAQAQDWTILKTLNILLGEERKARTDKARERRLKQASFPYVATIEEFDFGFQTSISKKQMNQLL